MIRKPAHFLALAAALAVVFPFQARAIDGPETEVVMYRAALDQLAAGKSGNAKLLLESMPVDSRSPESAALLAYLQEKAGNKEEARRTLNAVAMVTPFSSTYLARLGGPAQLPVAAAVGTLAVTPMAAQNRNAGNPARLAATDPKLTQLEKYMFRIVNDERRKNGRRELAYDDSLAEVARAHSAEMRDKDYFAHESPTKGLETPMDRYNAAKMPQAWVLAENVYRAYGSRSFLTEADTKSAHESLMNSPGHRANLMSTEVAKIGIGLAADKTGNIWITQMFVRQ